MCEMWENYEWFRGNLYFFEMFFWRGSAKFSGWWKSRQKFDRTLKKIHTPIQNTYFKKFEKKMSYKNEMKLKRFTSTQNTYSKNSKLSPNLYFQKKWRTKNIQKNVSHTSKKCLLNVCPRKFLKPKTILRKIRLPPRNVF